MPKLSILDESSLSLQVWPGDLDLNFHVNNGRYLTLLDLGRTDLLLRSPLFKVCFKNKWLPVIGSVTLQYRRSMYLFQKFTIKTKTCYWDEKWFYMRQEFHQGGKLVAVALIKGLLMRGRQAVPMREVVKEVGIDFDYFKECPPELSNFQKNIK